MGNKSSRSGKARGSVPGLCPCGSGLGLSECCGRWLTGGAEPLAAPTPEALMRSRYSAFDLGDEVYLLATWAPETRPAELFAPGEERPKWMRLTVHEASVAEDGLTGRVSFTALGRTSRGAFRMRERSRFRRDDAGRWLYVDGDVDPEDA